MIKIIKKIRNYSILIFWYSSIFSIFIFLVLICFASDILGFSDKLSNELEEI